MQVVPEGKRILVEELAKANWPKEFGGEPEGIIVKPDTIDADTFPYSFGVVIHAGESTLAEGDHIIYSFVASRPVLGCHVLLGEGEVLATYSD